MAQTPDEKRRKAVALAYQETDAAPRVIAKGHGDIAQRIIDKAKEHGLQVHESAELVSLLMQVDLDAHIPSELYQTVAELLAWVYELEAQARGQSLPLE